MLLLQLGHDQQRGDLRFERHIACNENDRSILSDRARKCQIGIPRAKHGAGSRRCILAKQHRRRARRRERLFVFRVREKRHVARPGILYAGHADDLGLDRDAWREVGEPREDHGHLAVERTPEVWRGRRQDRHGTGRHRRGQGGAAWLGGRRPPLCSRGTPVAQATYSRHGPFQGGVPQHPGAVGLCERPRRFPLCRLGMTHEEQIVARGRGAHHRRPDAHEFPDGAHLEIVGHDHAVEPEGARPAPGRINIVLNWRQELERGFKRMTNLAQMTQHPVEPRTGQTPREEVYRKGKARLYRYASRRTHRTPVLFVPNLGISRPYIFDLLPGGSFVEHMTKEGFDFYLLDWGVFGPEDNDLSFEDCVVKILPRAARKVLESSGAESLSVLGYCMGAPLSASFVASHPEFPVKNYINMAGPIDFSKVGLFGLWLDRRFFDVDRFIDTVGYLPADMVKAGFKLLRPTMDLSTNLNLWWNLWNDRYVRSFKALNTWANEYMPIPGCFFKQWVGEFYQGNRLIKGELDLGGRRVDLSTIDCSVLAVGAETDYIAPPACVKALVDVVAGRDKEYLELHGGHISLIAGRQASKVAWPAVSGWLSPRSH